MKASKVIFSMQLNWGINWNRNVTQNFTGGWYLTRREWAVRAPKATARPKTNLCSWSSRHCFQQTHICLLKQNFNFNSSSSKFSRLRTPWPSEILLNATSKLLISNKCFSEGQHVQDSESPQKEGSNPTSCSTESSHTTPLVLGTCSTKDHFQSYIIYTWQHQVRLFQRKVKQWWFSSRYHYKVILLDQRA